MFERKRLLILASTAAVAALLISAGILVEILVYRLRWLGISLLILGVALLSLFATSLYFEYRDKKLAKKILESPENAPLTSVADFQPTNMKEKNSYANSISSIAADCFTHSENEASPLKNNSSKVAKDVDDICPTEYDRVKSFAEMQQLFNETLRHLKKSNAIVSSFKLNLNKRKKQDFIARDFEQAIEKNQFVLFYQPKVSLSDGKIVGLEGFIRWNHPRLGLLPPSSFLPQAEKCAKIKDIGHWVVTAACSDISGWSKKSLNPLPISLNFSMAEILDKDFLPTLISTTHKFAVAHNYLQIEISEKTFFSNLVYCNKLAKILKENDFYVIIENLTVKYCNIENLSSICANQFTIHRSVMAEMEVKGETKDIVKQIIEVGEKNKISVLCEGVEKEIHLDILREINCPLAKGYYFASPKPCGSAMEFMA